MTGTQKVAYNILKKTQLNPMKQQPKASSNEKYQRLYSLNRMNVFH